MRTMNRDMDHASRLPICMPTDQALAEAMLARLIERQRARRVAAELAPKIQRALGVRRRGTS